MRISFDSELWNSTSRSRMVRALAVLSSALILAAAGVTQAHAQAYKILHTFAGQSADGAYPEASLVLDAAGNLYGTTSQGGSTSCMGHHGCGTVFKIDTSGQETTLYRFTGGNDGAYPTGTLFPGSVLYGTAYGDGPGGQGVVFSLNKSGKQTVLHGFSEGPGGYGPFGGVVEDSSGNLYGTTFESNLTCQYGCGTVFKLDPLGNETTLYSFTGGADGDGPMAGVILDPAGNLYGTATQGGNYVCGYGCGTVYEISPAGVETTLYEFSGPDGHYPNGGVIRDEAGNLYGTTESGGAYGYGVVFKIDSSGNESVIYSFTGGSDGAYPLAGVIRDPAGNLYGTTQVGGARNLGVVFKLSPSGQETVLHSFLAGSDGAQPYGGLVRDSAGNLYGTTYVGGSHAFGIVFEIAAK